MDEYNKMSDIIMFDKCTILEDINYYYSNDTFCIFDNIEKIPDWTLIKSLRIKLLKINKKE